MGFENYCLYCSEYKRKIEKLEKEVTALKERKVVVEGWKGKDKIKIVRVGDIWEVTEHRKDKKTKKVVENVHKIPHNNLLFLQRILGNMERNVKARTVWRKIITEKDLDLEINAFNGGSNRAKVYFPLYYYPLKILEHFGLVEYSGSGIIKRISGKELFK